MLKCYERIPKHSSPFILLIRYACKVTADQLPIPSSSVTSAIPNWSLTAPLAPTFHPQSPACSWWYPLACHSHWACLTVTVTPQHIVPPLHWPHWPAGKGTVAGQPVPGQHLPATIATLLAGTHYWQVHTTGSFNMLTTGRFTLLAGTHYGQITKL